MDKAGARWGRARGRFAPKVERAKGFIMEQYSVTEQQAYSVLCSKSMASRKAMHAVAETVLEMDQIA